MDHRQLADVSVLLPAAGLAFAFALGGHAHAALAVTVLAGLLAASMAESRAAADATLPRLHRAGTGRRGREDRAREPGMSPADQQSQDATLAGFSGRLFAADDPPTARVPSVLGTGGSS